MAYTRQYPLSITPDGDSVEDAVVKLDDEFDSIINNLNQSGALQLFGTKRQSVLTGPIDSNGNPNYLTASGLQVSIDGSSKPIYVAFANGFNDTGTIDILSKISSLISSSWTLPANQTCYLYIDKDISTGLLSYGYSLMTDLYQKAAPSSPTLDQHYFNVNDFKMYRWNGSAWEQKQRIFIAKAVAGTSTMALYIYPYRSQVPLTARKINGATDTGYNDITLLLNSPVRQTVYYAAVDNNGMANYISAGAGLTVSVAATAKSIKLTAAGGDPLGDRFGVISADASITGLVGSKTVSSITYSGTTATATTATPHGLTTGAEVVISGATPTAYNGIYKITVIGPTTFSYLTASNPGANASGGSYLVTNYIYADVDDMGGVSLGTGLLQPIYQQGGNPSTTNGQWTFNIGQMEGYIGSGTTYSKAYRVYMGEAYTGSATVQSAISYALSGNYTSPWLGPPLPLANSNTQQICNMGHTEYDSIFEIQCITADAGYLVGDIVQQLTTESYINVTNWVVISPIKNRNNVSVSISANGIYFTNKTTGAIQSINANSWKYRFKSRRSF